MTMAEYASWCALGCFAVGSALCAAGVTAAESSAASMLEGYWDPDSQAFHDVGITITATRVTVGKCPAAPYSIIKDAQGQGPTAIPAEDAADWREIVIELQPEKQPQKNCVQWRVLAFSIPASMRAHADVALYSSREEFESKPGDFKGWGVWEKDGSH